MNAHTRRRIGQAQALGTMQADTLFQLLIVFAAVAHSPATTDEATPEVQSATSPEVQTVTPTTFLHVQLQPDGQCLLMERDGTVRPVSLEEIVSRARSQEAGLELRYPVTPVLQTLTEFRRAGVAMNHQPQTNHD